MGTNFYTKKRHGYLDPTFHIGKRSAAGLYCWDCKETLCKDGVDRIHYESDWYDRCPKCGASPKKEKLEDSTAGRELGFNKSLPMEKTDVSSCCSFNWCIDPEVFYKKKPKRIWDEYGRKFTYEEFLQILEECPIQYTDSIGGWFS